MRPHVLAATLAWLLLSACGGRAAAPSATSVGAPSSPPAPAESACAGAKPLSIRDDPRAAPLRLLEGSHTARLTLACASGAACKLPPDRTLTLRIEPTRAEACELESCRVSYLGALPFEGEQTGRCPVVLWSSASVHLTSESGTLDEQLADVNLLASPAGEGFVRFTIDSPAARAHVLGPGDPRSLLIDVQVEAAHERIRGRLSALAAPLPPEPAGELRFTAIWSATWESGP